MAALEVEGLLRPLSVHDLELLGEELQPRGLVGEREPVHRMLGLVPAGAEPELDPAARDVVGGGHDLRELRRMAERRR